MTVTEYFANLKKQVNSHPLVSTYWLEEDIRTRALGGMKARVGRFRDALTLVIQNRMQPSAITIHDPQRFATNGLTFCNALVIILHLF